MSGAPDMNQPPVFHAVGIELLRTAEGPALEVTLHVHARIRVQLTHTMADALEGQLAHLRNVRDGELVDAAAERGQS
jgi:hypothetical protein